MDRKFHLSSDKIGIVFKIEPLGNSSINLYIVEMHSAIHDALRAKGIRDAVGLELHALPEADMPEFDEWVEFILRSRYMPYIQNFTVEKDGAVTSHMLQYFDLLKDWYVVSVTCGTQPDDLYALVEMAKIEDFSERSMLRQLMTLKQLRRVYVQMIHSGGYWIIDRLSGNMFVTRHMAQILHMEDRHLILPTQQIVNMNHPDDRDRVIAILNGVDKGTSAYHSRMLLEDGETVFLFSFASPIYDEQGRLARVFGFSENITEHIKGRKELEKSRARFGRIVESMNVLYIVVNQKGEYTYISPNSADMLGIDPDALIGREIGFLIGNSDDREKSLADLKRIMRDKTSGQLKIKLTVKGGLQRWYRFSILALRQEDGVTTDTVGISYDITEEVLGEERMHYLATHDSMTDTNNRARFWELLGQRYSDEAKGEFCLVLLDINGLKLINDIYGQLHGDQMIRDVTSMVKKLFPANRHIARIGGDEFAVIVYDTDIVKIEACCEGVNDFCLSTNTRMLPISVSWGLACRHEAEDNAQSLFQLAEKRMMNTKMLQKRSMHSQVVFSLKEALKARNMETSAHMSRMENMVSALGKKLGLSADAFNRLLLLASLHDVGKLGVPDDIINKPGPLNDDEWAIMRGHCNIGHRIVLESPELTGIAQEILCHHERWDGKGYPGGKKGDEIPFLSQIISVVDSYDVITHKRVYKEALSHSSALAELKRCRGTQFSPAVTDLFLEIFSHLTEEDMTSFLNCSQ
ncbi:MAG: diguanylate cyclase [Oscillospiraceae bacterium]|jgi:diguanylate cyclase (GGDEF)-like protein/PAS domain S-box-containing protein|nr:diguanylate cyclase [Oscillospiraceae bacterium]